MSKRALFLLLLSACATQDVDVGSSEESLLTFPSNPNKQANYALCPATGLNYEGGSIMKHTPDLKLIYFGTNSAWQKAFMNDFVYYLTGSPLANILTSYTDSSGSRPSGNFNVLPADYSLLSATGPLNGDTSAEIFLIASGNTDPDTIYLLIGGSNVAATSEGGEDFCDGMCGWHGATPTLGLKYAFIGNPSYCRNYTTHPDKCQFPSTYLPPNDADLDRMANTLWHELAELVTDPVPFTAYTDHEIADLCEQPAGSTDAYVVEHDNEYPDIGYQQLDRPYNIGTSSNPQYANVHLGVTDYLLQTIWQDAPGGGCVNRLVENKPSNSGVQSRPSTGDLAKDGAGDLIYRNTSTGNVKVRLVDTAGNAQPSVTVGTKELGHQIVGIADFDANGASDILWHNSYSGDLNLWTLVGTTATEHSYGNLPAHYAIKAVGDFNADKYTDALVLDQLTNETYLWINSGSNQFSESSLTATSLHPYSTQSIDTVGAPIDANARSSVLWRKYDSSTFAETYRWWKFDSSLNITAGDIVTTGIDHVLGIGDVDGNDGSELIGTTAKGNVVWTTLATSGSITLHTIALTPDPVWRFAGVTKAAKSPCLLWYNRQTGKVRRWALDTGTGAKSSHVDVVSSHSLNDQLIAY